MHFIHLIERVSEASGLPKTKVKKVLESLQGVVKEVTRSGGTIAIPRFGTFFPRELRSRPIFGGTRRISRARSIHFRESRRA